MEKIQMTKEQALDLLRFLNYDPDNVNYRDIVDMLTQRGHIKLNPVEESESIEAQHRVNRIFDIEIKEGGTMENYPEKQRGLKRMFFIVGLICVLQFFVIAWMAGKMEFFEFHIYNLNKRILTIENRYSIE